MHAHAEVLDYLRQQQDNMIVLLKDLVLIESPSTEPDSQGAILERLEAEFEQVDYRVTRLSARH